MSGVDKQHTTFLAGGSKYLGNRGSGNIWDGNANSWFEHDGWEPTNGRHKWSVARLDDLVEITSIKIAPRPGSQLELDGYSIYGSSDPGEVESGDNSQIDLDRWTVLATIQGITDNYEVETGRTDVHGGQCYIVPMAKEDAFDHILIYAPGDKTEIGNGDILNVEVFGKKKM